MVPQSHESPNFENFETLTWESQDKMTFGCSSHGQAQSILKREGGGFPQVRTVLSVVNPCLLVVGLCIKVLQLCNNQLVVWFVHVRVNN